MGVGRAEREAFKNGVIVGRSGKNNEILTKIKQLEKSIITKGTNNDVFETFKLLKHWKKAVIKEKEKEG